MVRTFYSQNFQRQGDTNRRPVWNRSDNLHNHSGRTQTFQRQPQDNSVRWPAWNRPDFPPAHSNRRHQPRNNPGYRPAWGRSGIPSARAYRMTQRTQTPRVGFEDRSRHFVINPEYFGITREHFTIIKSVHHRHQLEHGLPPSLKKKDDAILHNSVSPAFNDDYFRAEMQSITQIWSDATVVALRIRYDTVIQDSLNQISNSALSSERFELSISFVAKWARKQLRRKLLDEELDEALTLIRVYQKIDQSTDASSSGLPPVRDEHQEKHDCSFTSLKGQGTLTSPIPGVPDSNGPSTARSSSLSATSAAARAAARRAAEALSSAERTPTSNEVGRVIRSASTVNASPCPQANPPKVPGTRSSPTTPATHGAQAERPALPASGQGS